ncbi:Arf-GAP domain and FG repeat-containing protein 2 [Apodemus speciosus]|uniref:Arf-GAP domain and FG repeat-containing protein 2 n=1 Tax=Apodemus speciosus TaxID=105296 RepID=A0ABQ0ETG6_APOSI
MAAKKGPGPGGGVGGSKAEAEAASEVWCRRVRELGGCSQAGNRHCFECAQRGVTYVDITVGSFVCTTCSGLLRGLNPPHRVKSISMTTFTEPEVLFLQSRGNEVCRKIWLGLFDARTSLMPDSRDPQKVKEFLQEKYEKKRWYVPPEQVKGSSYSKGSASATAQGSVPEGKPIRTLLGDPVPSLSDAAPTSSQPVGQSQARTAQARSTQPPSHSSTKKASTDLLADIGGDPFAAPQVAPAFASFPGFGANRMLTGSYSFGSSQMSAFAVAPLAAPQSAQQPPDVGGLLGSGDKLQEVSLAEWSPDAGDTTGVFGMPSRVPALQSAVPGVSGSAGLLFGAPARDERGPALDARPVHPPGPSPPPSLHPCSPHRLDGEQQNDTPQEGSSFGDLGPSKLGQRPLSQPAGISTNPFMTGSSTFASKPPTTNPFL